MNSNNALFNNYNITRFNYDNKINTNLKDEIRSKGKNEIVKENNELFNFKNIENCFNIETTFKKIKINPK